MRKDPFPITSRKILERLVACGAAKGTEDLAPHVVIRTIRKALRMTQTQLARRAGMPQSHLAKTRDRQGGYQLSTLNKLLRAMFCEPMVLPRFQKTPQAALTERIKEVARLRVARAASSTSEDKNLRGLIRSEEERLMREPSSEIWDEPQAFLAGGASIVGDRSAMAVRIVDKKDEDDRDTLRFWLTQPVKARIDAVEFLRRQCYLVTGNKTLPRLVRSIQLRDLHE